MATKQIPAISSVTFIQHLLPASGKKIFFENSLAD
jgi:hypothetical protein